MCDLNQVHFVGQYFIIWVEFSQRITANSSFIKWCAILRHRHLCPNWSCIDWSTIESTGFEIFFRYGMTPMSLYNAIWKTTGASYRFHFIFSSQFSHRNLKTFPHLLTILLTMFWKKKQEIFMLDILKMSFYYPLKENSSDTYLEVSPPRTTWKFSCLTPMIWKWRPVIMWLVRYPHNPSKRVGRCAAAIFHVINKLVLFCMALCALCT